MWEINVCAFRFRLLFENAFQINLKFYSCIKTVLHLHVTQSYFNSGDFVDCIKTDQNEITRNRFSLNYYSNGFIVDWRAQASFMATKNKLILFLSLFQINPSEKLSRLHQFKNNKMLLSLSSPMPIHVTFQPTRL